MQKIKNIAITAAVGVILFSCVGLFFRQSKKAGDELVVGTMSGWAPFMTINTPGEYVGFDVDVAQKLAEKLNKKLVIKDLGSLAACFVALEQNKVDMVFSGLDITQDRLKKMNMVAYTGEAVRSFSLLFWQKIPSQIRTIEDFKNMSDGAVCAEPGSAQDKFLSQFAFINKKPLPSTTDMVLDLRFGKSTAALLEPQVAKRLQKQEPKLVVLPVPLPEEFVVYGMGIAIKKANEQLATVVAKAVQDLRQDGALKKLENLWGLKG